MAWRLFGSVIPFGGTFQTFSDYMRPAIRLAALSHIRVLFVFTHDSIGLGEDGPTHQSVEHLAALRAIPNLAVIRPCDAHETREAWRAALKRSNGPTAFALSRQKVDADRPQKICRRQRPAQRRLHSRRGRDKDRQSRRRRDSFIIATGSEVGLAMKARDELQPQGTPTRVVSMPCWEFFDAQPQKYKDDVLPPRRHRPTRHRSRRLTRLGKIRRRPRRHATVDRFGASAPAEDVFRDYGFTVENVVKKAKALI